MAKDITSNVYNVVFYVALVWVAVVCQFLHTVPPFVHMMVNAIALLYIGSFLSLKFFSFIYNPTETTEKAMTAEEALKMPLYATITLLSIFIIFKYINKDYLNYALLVYFGYLGAYATKYWVDSLLSSARFLEPLRKIQVLHIERWDLRLTLCDIALYVVGGGVVAVYIVFRDWLSNNLLGAAFCIYGFENIYIGNFSVAFGVLALFFLYDIYFVFGTTVMVTVATGIDGPIKFVFPRLTDPRNSMLGLGDVLVPGLLITLCLRFDLVMHLRRLLSDGKASLKTVWPSTSSAFPKPYFRTCMIGYIVGLVVTIAIGVIFNAAQPALLYLVPLTVGPLSIHALLRGEFKTMFWYNEEEETKVLKQSLKD